MLEDTTRSALIWSLSKAQTSVAEALVPWFTTNMPSGYFRRVSYASQLAHMRALSAQFDPNTCKFGHVNLAGKTHGGRVVFQSECPETGDLEVTFFDFSGNPSGLLAAQLAELDSGVGVNSGSGALGNLSRVQVFTSMDDALALNVFTFENPDALFAPLTPPAKVARALGEVGQEFIPGYAQHVQRYADDLHAASPPGIDGLEWSQSFELHNLASYIARCSEDYVSHTGPRSFLQQKLLFDKVHHTEDMAFFAEPADLDVSSRGLAPEHSGLKAELESDAVSGRWWLKMAITNSVPLPALRKIVGLFRRRGVDVERLLLDVVPMEDLLASSAAAPSSSQASPGLTSGGGLEEGQRQTVTMARALVRINKDAVADSLAGGLSVDAVNAEANSSVSSPCTDDPKFDEAAFFQDLARDVKRLKWLDDSTLDLAYRSLGSAVGGSEVGLQRAEVITCLSSMLHSLLSKQDVWAFSKTNINNSVLKGNSCNLRHACAIADLFIARFDPEAPLPDARYQAWLEAVRAGIESDLTEDAVANEVLHCMVSVLEATRRTNLFLENRYALSLRLAPYIFKPGYMAKSFDAYSHAAEMDLLEKSVPGLEEASTGKGELPFGVYYVHGRRFNGFHVRFRDIARGGMRLVTPQSVEQLAIESARHFDEAYQLASAQQLKNKDIPEGGSKCVVLMDTCSLPAGYAKDLVLRKSVKAFTDAMLDLIVNDSRNVVDLMSGKEEMIYLGPDEQVTPDDINWIVSRAMQRGYPIPSAFMSSKPDAGINHKTYGVTSEGVQVFLDVALREMGMHPTQTGEAFSVKMTGGPDGDVAGNMIKILEREYGDRVKIVGLADVSGCAEDREGLDPSELRRLVDYALPIACFDPGKLRDPDARLHICDPAAHATEPGAEEAVKARNTMHNRVVADAFIPAGGRPATIHEANWRAFLRPSSSSPATGKPEPSAKLIVEGANLFITPGARAAMYAETGIPIVKDSSANKCGVICSSFEIMSSMLLDEEEFAANKEELGECLSGGGRAFVGAVVGLGSFGQSLYSSRNLSAFLLPPARLSIAFIVPLFLSFCHFCRTLQWATCLCDFGPWRSSRPNCSSESSAPCPGPCRRLASGSAGRSTAPPTPSPTTWTTAPAETTARSCTWWRSTCRGSSPS